MLSELWESGWFASTVREDPGPDEAQTERSETGPRRAESASERHRLESLGAQGWTWPCGAEGQRLVPILQRIILGDLLTELTREGVAEYVRGQAKWKRLGLG